MHIPFLSRLVRYNSYRRLKRSRIPYSIWKRVLENSNLVVPDRLDKRIRLRQLAGQFIQQKHFQAAAGLALTDFIIAYIAVNACVPILELGLKFYAGWREIIVYPDTFIVEREAVDEIGLLHRGQLYLGGEAWNRGPVVLSWADAQAYLGSDRNVIVHEFAHKLDMLNGRANGMPVLHKEMNINEWTRVFSQAFAQLHQQVDLGIASLDAYAIETPAEFFAVCSEVFFTHPAYLQSVFADVYRQLNLYYRWY